MDAFIDGMRKFFKKWYAGTISVNNAYKEYADELQKPVDELTLIERQLALLDYVIREESDDG